MRLPSLLLAALLLNNPTAFAQDQPALRTPKKPTFRLKCSAMSGNQLAGCVFFVPHVVSDFTTPSEPWRILPVRLPDGDSLQAFLRRVARYQADFYQMNACGEIISPYEFWPGGHLSKEQLADKSCYAKHTPSP